MINVNDKKIIGGRGLHGIISCFLAIIGTFQVYPFIGLADGFTRWRLALEIVNTGRIQSDTLMSPILPYFQALTYKLTNSYGLFTFIQAGLFYYAIGILITLLLGDRKIKIGNWLIYLWNIISIIIIALPTVYVFPLMLTDSAPIFVLLVFGADIYKMRIKQSIKALILGIITFLCIGIRINSIILWGLILITLLGIFILKRQISCILLVITIAIGGILGVTVPRKLVPKAYNASVLGMVWELIALTDNGENKELRTQLSTYGDVKEALQRYKEPYLNSIVWDNNPPFNAMKISDEYAKPITKLYITQFFTHPVDFLINKTKWAMASLGIGNYLISSRRGIHRVDERTQSMGGLPTDLQVQLREEFIEFTDRSALITRCPIIAIISSILIIMINYGLGKKLNKVAFLLWGIAVGYYLSFCLNTQAFEYRYYAPTFYLLLSIIICGILEAIINIYNKIKSKNESTV